ncbi:MAG: GNAT family N-acetyltransferase [Spirochaetales bacterium]|nr:GNAT family N-acetyltransferase [Spirochaetales bacterium]
MNSNQLPKNLVLKTACSKTDISRIAEFNKLIHEGVAVELFVKNLIKKHPTHAEQYWMFIEDSDKKLVVSSICLIPWELKLCGITVKAAELGFVGTLAEYRSKGLINILMQAFFAQAEKDGYTVSIIQGIPYYYRRFGYEYAIQLENHIDIELRHITGSGKKQYSFVKVQKKDTPTLQKLYNRRMADYDISAVRTKAMWEYLLGPAQKADTVHDNYMIKNKKNEAIGYFRIAHHGFGEGLMIDETSCLNTVMMEEIFSFARTIAENREKPSVQLILPLEHELSQYAVSCGGRITMEYGWQVKVLGHVKLFQLLKPVMEKRIAQSSFRGLTKKLLFNFYKDTIEFEIQKGSIRLIQSKGWHEQTEVMIPPFLVPQLLFGWKNFSELKSIYPDVWCSEKKEAALFEILFPKLSGYLHLMY